MKATAVFVVLTILGSLCHGKPVDKKKKPVKVNDKPKQGKMITQYFEITKINFLKWLDLFKTTCLKTLAYQNTFGGMIYQRMINDNTTNQIGGFVGKLKYCKPNIT